MGSITLNFEKHKRQFSKAFKYRSFQVLKEEELVEEEIKFFVINRNKVTNNFRVKIAKIKRK